MFEHNIIPISVPLRNQPIAVARSVGLYISPIHEAPTIRKAVPWNAVRMRKTKKEARFGLAAVPMEHPRNKIALVRHDYIEQSLISLTEVVLHGLS